MDLGELPAERSVAIERTDDAIITEDERGIIRSWNRGAERMFGYTSGEVIGEPLDMLRATGVEDDRGLDPGTPGANFETVRRHKDGRALPVRVTVSRYRADDGSAGVRHVLHLLETRSDRAARRLAAIVESSEDAIVSKNLDGIVMSWNPAAERMFGYDASEMIGQSIRKIIPHDRQSEEDAVIAAIRRGDRVSHFETLRRRRDGTLFPISLSVSPIRDAGGTVVGASKIARDITDRKRQEEERARLLAAAQEEVAITERLNHAGAIVAGTLDLQKIVQTVTDTATDVTGADFGVFLYGHTVADGVSESETAVSGDVARDAAARLPELRALGLLGPVFSGQGRLRVDDVLDYPPFLAHEARVRAILGEPVSCLMAVPVAARSGEVLGALLFGHSRAGAFTDRHERLAAGVASWASLALENARLYSSVHEASRLKDEFLATLSHELRTPLNAILGYARMIRSGLVVGERQRRAVETIERNAQSLTQIVEDVLDVARIVSGKIRLNVQTVDVSAVVRDAVEAVLPAANARGVRLQTVPDEPGARIAGDPERLQQVIWNLLSNAVKFTGRGGEVRVSVERHNAHVAIVVRDTGAGIPPAFLPYVFERFRQADSGTTRQHGGLGLGLAIARHLVEMHGGTISAESEGAGRGATFRVELPSAMVAAAAGRTLDPHGRRGAEPEAPVPDLRGIRVLVVDDDRDGLRLVSEILEAAGADVQTASSAPAALESLDGTAADVLVTDLAMPQMDGFELIARVRQHASDAVRRVPAAALTAYARSEDRIKALRSGFQMHLAKPIDPGELMLAVASLAARRTDAQHSHLPSPSG
jgi:PAS domain S-box-containing protein